MKMNVLLCTLVFCSFVVSCTNKLKQEKTQQAPINNAVGINDTLGISLHPEYTVYSTKQKQITFVLHNNSGTDISFGGYYSYTYEDEKGIWRDVPMQLVVFDVEYVLMQGDKYYYNAELFKHTPGHYRTSSDTMRITMQTEHSVYPVGTETISVKLANGNSKDLFFGERYNVARKEGNRWILLHDGGVWNDIGYGLGQGDAHLFTARLRPIVNDNKPGTYKVVKEIGFKGSSQKWFMGAEFRIE